MFDFDCVRSQPSAGSKRCRSPEVHQASKVPAVYGDDQKPVIVSVPQHPVSLGVVPPVSPSAQSTLSNAISSADVIVRNVFETGADLEDDLFSLGFDMNDGACFVVADSFCW